MVNPTMIVQECFVTYTTHNQKYHCSGPNQGGMQFGGGGGMVDTTQRQIVLAVAV